jgi:osmotically inducible protein OsmC
MPIRTATARWEGNLKEGKGRMKLGSGAWEGAYSFATRFEDQPGTNPEELIGAAHAGCFSMAFAAQLGKAGFKPKSIRTKADVHLEKQGDKFTITRVALDMEAEILEIEEKQFQSLADEAKKGCPVSRLLTGATIDLRARLIR